MKSLVVCAVLVMWVAVASCDKRAVVEAVIRNCMAENKVSETELVAFFTAMASDANMDNVEDKLKCHMKCTMENVGHMKNGVLNEEAVMSSLNEVPQLKDHKEEIAKIVKECKNEKGANDCDTAYKISLCFKEHKSEAAASGTATS